LLKYLLSDCDGDGDSFSDFDGDEYLHLCSFSCDLLLVRMAGFLMISFKRFVSLPAVDLLP
jgi:hypothetical protein